MSRCLILLIAVAASLSAATLPEKFGTWTRTAIQAIQPDDRPLWDEFGLKAADRATYTGSGGTLTVSAYRFADPTGAFAAAQWQREPGFMHYANYLLKTEGKKELPEELLAALPERINSAVPPLPGYLPARGKIAGSERYSLGPQTLARFEPRISKELAAFEKGAEAESAKYRSGTGDIQLTLFAYPTPQMAIERYRQFEQLPGAAVKRTGPIIAVIPEGRTVPAAARVLEEITYNPKLTWNEYVPKNTPQDAAKMILAIALLAAGLIVAALTMGVFFGGSRVLARRFGFKTADQDFTSLNIGQ